MPCRIGFRALAAIVSLGLVACGSTDGSTGNQDEQSDDALGLFPDATELLPEPAGPAAKHAFVLAHGFNASTTNSWSFYGVAEALAKDHAVVVLAEVPPFASPLKRAEYLARDVDRALARCKETAGCDASGVNLIAHSMGGLDSRALIGSLHYGDRIKSLTTIASPHRGTAVADTMLGIIPAVADGVLDAAATVFARHFTAEELANESDVRAALSGLAESNAAEFARQNPDDPRVYVQSWAGVSSVVGRLGDDDVKACEGKLVTFKERSDKMDLRLVPMTVFVGHGTRGLPNDGMSTVESAKWGEFRGCIPANHYAEVGQPKREGIDRWSGFDHVRFYRTVAFDLAKRGF